MCDAGLHGRQVADRAPDVRRLAADAQAGPHVVQAARVPVAHGDDERPLATLRQADVRQDVDPGAHAVAHRLERRAQRREVRGEAAHEELARVLHDDDLGRQDAGERADAPDEGVARVVDDMVARERPAEPRARRAGRQDDQRVAQREAVAQLLRRDRREVHGERGDADVARIGGVAAERSGAGARLAHLRVGRARDRKRGVAVKAAAHPADTREEIDDRVDRAGRRDRRVEPRVGGRGEAHLTGKLATGPVALQWVLSGACDNVRRARTRS